MARLLELIHDVNPYQGFPTAEYEPDLQGWGHQHPIFEEIIREITPSVIIEVGTWKGASAIKMGRICRELGLNTEIVCIDTWLGSSELLTTRAHPEWRRSLNYRFGFPQIFYTFMRNVVQAHLTETITPFPASSDAAFYALRRLKVKADLVYIDGSHEFEAVARDLNLYSQLLTCDGVIIGDDFQSEGVRRAVDEFITVHPFGLESQGGKYVLRPRQPVMPGAETVSGSFDPKSVSVEELTQRIALGRPFSLSRWGDCEWHIVFGRTSGRNLDGHRYMPELVDDLNRILRSKPRYMLGLQPLARRVFEGRIEEWIVSEGLDRLHWINADVLHRASIKRTLGGFIKALRDAPSFAVVGPQHLETARPALQFDHHLIVPATDCYLQKEQLIVESARMAASLPVGSVITFSATATANVLIDTLFSDFGDRLFLIDVGSLWDPYAGVMSRTYMKDDTFHVSE
jgi:hypothetical protein